MRIFKQWQKDDMPLAIIYDNDAKKIGEFISMIYLAMTTVVTV